MQICSLKKERRDTKKERKEEIDQKRRKKKAKTKETENKDLSVLKGMEFHSSLAVSFVIFQWSFFLSFVGFVNVVLLCMYRTQKEHSMGLFIYRLEKWQI